MQCSPNLCLSVPSDLSSPGVPQTEERRRISSRLDYSLHEQRRSAGPQREQLTGNAAITANAVSATTAVTVEATIMSTQVGDSVKVSDHFALKTVLVDLTMDGCPDQTLRVYAIVDEQSNATLIDDAPLDLFGRQFPAITYKLIPADGSNIASTVGRQVSGL